MWNVVKNPLKAPGVTERTYHPPNNWFQGPRFMVGPRPMRAPKTLRKHEWSKHTDSYVPSHTETTCISTVPINMANHDIRCNCLKELGGLISAPLIPAGIQSFWWNPVEWNLAGWPAIFCIPELRPECSAEFAGTECNGMESGCLVTTLFGIHCLFVAHLLTNKHNVLPFPPPTIVSHHHHLSFPPPPTMLVTAANNARHHHCPLWLPTNANDHQLPQCHHDRPKNKDGRQQMTTNTHPMNNGLDPQTDVGGDKPRWVNPPLLTLHFVHTEYRCHVAVSDMAAKWWTTMFPTLSFIVVLNLGHHGEYPPSHIHPNSPRWDTGWRQPGTMMQHRHRTTTRTQDEDVAKTGGDKDTWGQDDEDTWQRQHTATMIHGDNDAWWRQYTATRWQQNFPFHITPTPTFNIPIPLTSPPYL